MSNRSYYRQSCPEGYVPYIIRKGDTLSSIAQQYNSTIQKIIDSNPTINPNSLSINQLICVPIPIQYYPSCPTTNYYVVMTGDTFESIASYFNVSDESLYYSNFGIDPNDLYEDQVLCIPINNALLRIEIDTFSRNLTLIRNGSIIKTYPIAQESPNFPIPRGKYTILNKQVDPGVEKGARWLGLSEPGLGIHGTNTPQFIELVSSKSSIIMTNQDISELFNLVSVGTIVIIQ